MRRIPTPRAVLPALALVLAMAGAAAHAVEPTPQQAAHCAAAGSEPAKAFCLAGYQVAPLHLPDKATEGVPASAQQMGIHKPPGPGPFPALVLMHTCGDLAINDQMPFWTRAALQGGYVVFVLDSYSQRGVHGDMGCSSLGVTPPARARDAFDAASHLARFPFVNSRRIAAMGFSNGGRIAYLLASAATARSFASGAGFAASIAVYGQCWSRTRKLSYLRDDIDVPLLALLGELDDDGDPKECVPRLSQAKAAGAPVEWKVFPGTGHVWDQPSRLPGKRMPFNEPPNSVLFEYNPAVTAQSRDIAFEFLARVMK